MGTGGTTPLVQELLQRFKRFLRWPYSDDEQFKKLTEAPTSDPTCRTLVMDQDEVGNRFQPSPDHKNSPTTLKSELNNLEYPWNKLEQVKLP